MASRRLILLKSHLEASEVGVLERAPTSAAVPAAVDAPRTRAIQPQKTLPRFDLVTMEHYLDDLRSLKVEVYELFRQHPELLPAVQEGQTKGEFFTFLPSKKCLRNGACGGGEPQLCRSAPPVFFRPLRNMSGLAR
jgi:hypothetical protein